MFNFIVSLLELYSGHKCILTEHVAFCALGRQRWERVWFLGRDFLVSGRRLVAGLQMQQEYGRWLSTPPSKGLKGILSAPSSAFRNLLLSGQPESFQGP